MLQDEKVRRRWRSSPRILYLWIGERGLQLSGLIGRGSDAQWESVAELSLPEDPEDRRNVSCVYAALQGMAAGAVPAEWRGVDLRVVIADRWLAMASLPWTDALLRTETAREFARDYLGQLGFDVSIADIIRFDGLPYGQSRWVVAYPRVLLERIMECAARWDVRCRSVRPMSVLVCMELCRRPESEAFAIVGDETVTLGLLDSAGRWQSHQVRDINITSLDEPVSLPHLQLAWRRWGLRQALIGRVNEVTVIDATEAGNFQRVVTLPFVSVEDIRYHLRGNVLWLKKFSTRCDLDAIDTAVPPGLFQRFLMVCAAVVVLGLFMRVWGQHGQLQDTRAEYESVHSARNAPVKTVRWTREEQKRVAAVNAAIRQLNMPVDAVLQALSPPEGIRVAVLSIDTESTQAEQFANRLKISAEAPTASDMTKYVAFVAGRKPFTRAYLTRHDVSDDAEKRLRFIVEAQWND